MPQRREQSRRFRDDAQRSSNVRNCLISSVIALSIVVAGYSAAKAQTPAPKVQTRTSVPDISGDWGYTGNHSNGFTFSVTDPDGEKAGTPEDDTPYKPATLAKLGAERPPNG